MRAGRERFGLQSDFKLGAPILICIDSESWDQDAAYYTVIRGQMRSWRDPFSENGLQGALRLLENERACIRDERLKDAIIPSNKFSEINYIVESGRVARFFLADDSSSVREAQRLLRVGEILGFDFLSREKDCCVLDGSKHGRAVYASRRV
jgi:hypothetical protein